MDSVRPWLDSDDVRRMAQRLLAGRGSERLPTADTPFGDDFEGFAEGGSEKSGNAARSRPAESADPAELSVAAPAPPAAGDVDGLASETMPGSPGAPVELEQSAELAEPAVEVRPSESPRGPFLQRVQRFREWLGEQFAARGMFLLDREGVAIFDDGVNAKLQALARNLAQPSRISSGAGSNIHVRIEPGTILEVIPVDTHYGVMVLGAVVPQAVPARGVALIVDGLRRTATPPAPARQTEVPQEDGLE
jgi:hypothetical protein